eukprot:scaffold108463_cov35-Prasinocladus_malaysianus.AAC.1
MFDCVLPTPSETRIRAIAAVILRGRMSHIVHRDPKPRLASKLLRLNNRHPNLNLKLVCHIFPFQQQSTSELTAPHNAASKFILMMFSALASLSNVEHAYVLAHVVCSLRDERAITTASASSRFDHRSEN